MMSVKAAEEERTASPVAPAAGLGGRVRSDEADFVERRAFQDTAFLAQWAVLSLKPNDVVPGWDEHFVVLVRETQPGLQHARKGEIRRGPVGAQAPGARAREPAAGVPPPEVAMRNAKKDFSTKSTNCGRAAARPGLLCGAKPTFWFDDEIG